MPQENKYSEYPDLKKFFEPFIKGEFRISEMGNMVKLVEEMNKYDNSKHDEAPRS